MPDTINVLKAIDDAPTDKFEDFVKVLPDRPLKGERSAWRELHSTLGALSDLGLIRLTRHSMSNEIRTLTLTELGKERLDEALTEEGLSIVEARS